MEDDFIRIREDREKERELMISYSSAVTRSSRFVQVLKINVFCARRGLAHCIVQEHHDEGGDGDTLGLGHASQERLERRGCAPVPQQDGGLPQHARY